MRVGLVRLFATVLLLSAPAIVMTTSDANAKTSRHKSTSAAKPARSKYQAPTYSAIVIDAATSRVLSEDNADARSYPASLTKMMTLYLLFEALDKHEIRMDSTIPVSAHAAAAAPSKLNLTPKQTITVEQAIQALITKSANDVAVAVGERLGGTETAFAEKMTAKARALGMKQTTFRNASGLPNPEQFSSARDMAILGSRLIKDFPQHYGEFARMEFDYKGQTIRTHNHLLEFYEGADGIKTGYTAASGFNLVASATRNGYRVIGVMFGGTSASSRDKHLAAMMDQGFAALSGQPETLVAEKESDVIAEQIALAHEPATEDEAEQGDRDEPYQPATHADHGTIETVNIAPLPVAPETPKQKKIAALEAPTPAAKISVAKTDLSATWGVQIGAYSKREAAENQATTATAKLKSTYAQASALVMPVTVRGKQMYRARVMGLPDDELIRACSLLGKQAKAGCQAIAPDAGKVASR